MTNSFESFSNKTEDNTDFGLHGIYNSKNVIIEAKMACEISKQNILDHFADVGKMVEIGSGATILNRKRVIQNYF